jgi:hypothetical protein
MIDFGAYEALKFAVYRPYREVPAEALRGVGRDFGFEPTDQQAAAFGRRSAYGRSPTLSRRSPR